MPRRKKPDTRAVVTCRCYHCGDGYDEWADRLSDQQRKHMDGTPLGCCPGCAEVRKVERATAYAAKFAQREREPGEYTTMEDGHRRKWNQATGRGQ